MRRIDLLDSRGAVPLRILLIDPNVDDRAELKSALQRQNATVVAEAAYGIDAAHLVAKLQPDVAVVRVDEPVAFGVNTLDIVQRAAPHVTTIAASQRQDVDLLRTVMLHGARASIPLPCPRDAVDSIVEPATERFLDLAHRIGNNKRVDFNSVHGAIVTVFSPKGGVGKTTIVANLAVALTKRSARVVVVDTDAYFGDVALALGVLPPRTLPDLLTAMAEEPDVRITEFLTQHHSGLYVLPARQEGQGVTLIDPEAIVSLLNELSRSFDFVVVDTPGTFGPQVAAALDVATTALLITSSDIASVKDARLMLNELRRDGFNSDRLKLVVNHATNANTFSDEEIGSTIGQRVSWSLSHDRRAPQSTQLGTPLIEWKPCSRLSREIDNLSAYLTGTGRASGRSLLRRLLRR